MLEESIRLAEEILSHLSGPEVERLREELEDLKLRAGHYQGA